MSSLGCPNAVLQQVNQFWSMLDDLSLNDPNNYQKFIESKMKEGAEYYTPPQPDSCLCTEILGPKKVLLYINVCGWKRVPAPLDPSKPVPVYGGRLETDTDGEDDYSVVDVAFSPDVLREAQKDRREKEQVHLLALSFTQKQYGLCLDQQYNVTSSCLRGSLKDMQRRLGSAQHQLRHDTNTNTTHLDTALQTPAGLLQQIASMRMGESEDNTPEQLSTPVQLTLKQGDQNKNLIQVISSTVTSQPQQPQYQLTVNSHPSGLSRSMQLTVQLPGVYSSSECQLSISQYDVILEVADLYHLHLYLPETVIEETASARFNKKKQTLALQMSIFHGITQLDQQMQLLNIN